MICRCSSLSILPSTRMISIISAATHSSSEWACRPASGLFSASDQSFFSDFSIVGLLCPAETSRPDALGKRTRASMLPTMFMLLFILISVPIGIFSAWFAWKAWKVERMNVVRAMALLSAFSFATAITVATLILLAMNR